MHKDCVFFFNMHVKLKIPWVKKENFEFKKLHNYEWDFSDFCCNHGDGGSLTSDTNLVVPSLNVLSMGVASA